MRNRFLMIHQGFELYGSDRSFISTLQAIKQNLPKCHLTVIIPKYGPIIDELKPYADELLIEDIGAISLHEAKRRPISSIIKVIKSAFTAIKRINNSDVIYINTIVPFGYILACFFTFKPVIIHAREIPSNSLAFIFSVWFRISRFYTIYNSTATRNAFKFVNKQKTAVLWNGVDSIKEDNLYTIKKDEVIHLLLIGRISRRKGQTFFLKAFNTLSAEEKNKFKIYIVGETPFNQASYKEELVTYIEKNDLTQNVTLLPFDNDPAKYYSWADIVVVPSISPESFGRVAIEAMSASKPVLAANHGGLTEIVIHQKTGFLFEPNNIEALASILKKIAAMPENLHTLGIEGNLRYQKNFTLRASQKNLTKILAKFKIFEHE